MKKGNLFLANLLIILFQTNLFAVSEKEIPRSEDVLGKRFTCFYRKYGNTCLQLSVLKNECELKLFPGEGLPPQLTAEVTVKTVTEERVVQKPDALVGCVKIKSPKDALEFLRFFSSNETVYLFDEQILEVFPRSSSKECKFVCINDEIWNKLKLSVAAAFPLGNGFQVTRYVIKPIPEPWKVSLFRRVEHVGYDGHVNWLLEQKLETSIDDLAGLSFPMFL